MAKKTAKKDAKKTEPTQTAADLHEAARVARRSGDDAESQRLIEAARAAERVEAQTA
jgi:hypothetical protein